MSRKIVEYIIFDTICFCNCITHNTIFGIDTNNILHRGISFKKFTRKFTLADNVVVTGASISSAGATGPGTAQNSTFFIQSRGSGTGGNGTYTLNTGVGITAGSVVTTFALIPGSASTAGTVQKINNGGLSGSPTTDYITSGKALSVASTTITSAVSARGGDGGAGGRGHVRVYWY